MHGRFTETDVLIVGAGPTGLMLALELSAWGVPFRIIDKAEGRATSSRAFALHARSLELLQKQALAEELVRIGRAATRAACIIAGGRTHEIDFGRFEGGTPYPLLLVVSQADTERVLEGALRARDGHIEWSVELVAALDADAGVVATLRHRDGREEKVRARYLVGCDGTDSKVRHLAGIAFEGEPYADDFLLADIDVRYKPGLPDGVVAVVLPQRGILLAFPYQDGRLCRIIATGPRGRGNERREPTLSDVKDHFRRMWPGFAEFGDALWVSRFRLQHRVAESYQRGHLLLAGDAAHVHSPLLGHGLNAGLQDAKNLGWKLALIARGLSPVHLLETYEQERQPIGRRLVHVSDRLLSLAASQSPVIGAMRNVLASVMLPRIAESRTGGERVFRLVSELGVHYGESAAVDEDLSSASVDFRHAPGKGQRAPDAPLERLDGERVSLFSRLTGGRHHLLIFDPAAPLSALNETLARRIRREHLGICRSHAIVRAGSPALAECSGIDVCIDQGDAVHRLYGIREGGLYLIRPDGYVAYRSASLNLAGLTAYMQSTFGHRDAAHAELRAHRA